MTDSRIDILGKLLTFSRIHLQLALEEKWESWETMARQKEDLYKRLITFKGPLIHPEEKEIINGIMEAEKETSKELVRKKNEIKMELVEIDRFTGGVKNYRHSNPRISTRHFNIKV